MGKKKYILIGIISLITVIGGTFAWFSITSSQNNNGTIVKSGTLSINYQDGTIIGANNLMPDYEPSYNSTCEDGLCYRNDFTITNTGSLDVLLNGVLELETNTFENNKLMYSVYDGETLITEASPISNTENTDLLTNVRLDVPTGSKTYTLFIWLDESATNESLEKSYAGTIKINGNQVGIPENINFSGYVYDDNNNIVPNATILIESDPKTATTDENGYYSINMIPLGSHTLTVTKNDEEILKSPITLQYGQEYKVESKIITTNSEHTRFDIKTSNIENSEVAEGPKNIKEDTSYTPILTYDCHINNGNCADLKKEVQSGSNVDLTKKATKTNYVFKGWNTNPNAHVGLSSFEMPSINTTLYAIFEKEIIITFNKNYAESQRINNVSKTDNEIVESCLIYNNETECNIVSPSIIRNNYDGIGYALENSSKEVIWNPNTSKIINENKTYYAITKSSDSWIATFIKGSAKTISKENASCYKYNNEATCEVTAPTFELNDNYSKDGLVKVSGSATPDKVSENGIITLTTSSTYKTNIDAIVEIPTTQNCVDTTYDGTSKTLLTGTNYTLENNIKINAGTYEITAKLNNDSVWKDGTKEDKKISCEIKKRDVTYKADNNSKVYDGSALTKQTATLTSGILASNQNATFDITGTITNVGSVTNTLNGVTIKQDGTDVSSNYNITKVNGTLTVTRATTSTLGSCGNLTYNGSSQNLVTGGNEVTVTNNTGTDAKTYTVNVESTGNYAFSDGTTSKTLTCEIKKRDVTIKADSDSRAYNESALTKETATLTSGTLVSGHVATSNITGTITDVGSVTNTLNSVVIKDATSNDVTSNYNITKVNGTLTVTKAPTTIPTNTLCVSKTYDGTTQQLTSTTSGTGYTLSNYNQTNAGNYTITATLNSNYKWNDNSETTKSFSCSMSKRDVTYKADNNSKVYDGSALTKNTGTLTSGTLVSGHVATSNITGTITDVGSVTNTLNSVVIKDATSNDVTSNYNITKVNGTLTVNKKDVTVSANTISKVYDGNALTSSICSGNDLVSGQNVTCTMTSASTITNVGNTPNIIDTTIIKSSTTDVTSNYNITKTNGTLTITPANFINNSVLITGIVVNGNTLTATPTSNPTGTYSYQWWTSIDSTGTTKTNITNATSNTYKITQNEVGKYIGVTLTISKDNYITTTINKITNLVGDFNCSINGNPTEWTKTATLTGTISNGVQAYSWTNSTTTPTSWTNSTNTTQTKNITENNNYYLHIKSDNDNVKYCSVNVQKIDNEGPTITNLELTTNDKTITATITANDNDKSGVTKYYYSLDGEVYTESTNNNYTFTNLTYGETYTIYTYVKDALNNESIVSNSEITISIPCPEGSTLTNGYCTKLATVTQTCDSGTLSGTTCLKTATSSYTCTGVGGSLSGSNCWTSASTSTSTRYTLSACTCASRSESHPRAHIFNCGVVGNTYTTNSQCASAAQSDCASHDSFEEDGISCDVKSYTCSPTQETTYSCSSGWTKSGTQCYKAAVLANTCPTGWTINGATCIKTSTPVYSCEEGWTLSGTTCTKLPG